MRRVLASVSCVVPRFQTGSGDRPPRFRVNPSVPEFCPICRERWTRSESRDVSPRPCTYFFPASPRLANAPRAKVLVSGSSSREAAMRASRASLVFRRASASIISPLNSFPFIADARNGTATGSLTFESARAALRAAPAECRACVRPNKSAQIDSRARSSRGRTVRLNEVGLLRMS